MAQVYVPAWTIGDPNPYREPVWVAMQLHALPTPGQVDPLIVTQAPKHVVSLETCMEYAK